MSRRGGGANRRFDVKALSRFGKRYAHIDEDLDTPYDVDETSPQNANGCLPRIFNRGRPQQRPPRGGGGQHYQQNGAASSSRNIFNRLTDPIFRGGGGGGGARNANNNARRQLDYRKNVQTLAGSSAGQAKGPMIHMIRIPQGQMFGKDFILRSLGAYVEGDLKPILFKFTQTGDATFYIEEKDVTDAVATASRRISDPKSGTKMQVIVNQVPSLWQPMSERELTMIKQVLSQRYNADNRSLDLHNFGIDPIFKADGFHASLQRNNIAIAVVKLIDEHFGQLRSLNLSGNRIRYLDYIAVLVSRAKSVQALNLADNQIEFSDELEKLKGWQLRELCLDKNPICTTFPDANAYKSAIHKVFPKVTLLDGVSISREAEFAIEEENEPEPQSLPPPKPGFYLNADLQKLVESFVVEYFKWYDGDDPESSRKNLMPAYDDQAIFTLSIEAIGTGGDYARYSDTALFKEYRLDSHNVIQMDKWERYRAKIIHKGSINVVARLIRLPKTQHLVDSFLVDISYAADTVLCFTVQGLFRDGANVNTDSDEMRFFSRVFLVTPRADGKIGIINEQLYISALTPSHTRRYYMQLNKTQSSAAVASVSSTLSISSIDSSNIEQDRMLQQFMLESGMKSDWAKKCLEDQQWNYANAAQVFTEMKRQNLIPADAFR